MTLQTAAASAAHNDNADDDDAADLWIRLTGRHWVHDDNNSRATRLRETAAAIMLGRQSFDKDFVNATPASVRLQIAFELIDCIKTAPEHFSDVRAALELLDKAQRCASGAMSDMHLPTIVQTLLQNHLWDRLEKASSSASAEWMLNLP